MNHLFTRIMRYSTKIKTKIKIKTNTNTNKILCSPSYYKNTKLIKVNKKKNIYDKKTYLCPPSIFISNKNK